MSNSWFHIPRPPWVHRAACRDVGPGVFFPAHYTAARQAKAICGGCPVIDECLRHALDDRSLAGVWGGATEAERNQLRRRRAS